ncbi:hypothetical protein [Saccharothrix syringae]|uniref:Uncharacterized protein n=1 Tax=Saccharothrix syringae TaxID=103733 RepID=A0A5Q0H116_SACSY|nr:hypothetical protein [Saccharothrix syringae]QFZ19937.1 hypothetical protein EKG83_23160 [Saccharothrix syringae]
MPRGFYTDEKGRVRPVPVRHGRAGPLLLAGLLVLGAVGYGGAVGLSAGGAGGAGLGVTARRAESEDLARRGDADGAWQRMGLHGLRQTGPQPTECTAGSFGEVHEFLRRTGCASMDRALFAVGDGTGNTAVVAVAWVEFASRGDARRFQDLVDASGTGDVEPLGTEALDLGEVSFSGANHGSERHRGTVTVAEAELASGHLTPEVLDALAEVAALLPR